jgi:hypothetical protein
VNGVIFGRSSTFQIGNRTKKKKTRSSDCGACGEDVRERPYPKKLLTKGSGGAFSPANSQGSFCFL